MASWRLPEADGWRNFILFTIPGCGTISAERAIGEFVKVPLERVEVGHFAQYDDRIHLSIRLTGRGSTPPRQLILSL